jgi:hypothetical protein
MSFPVLYDVVSSIEYFQEHTIIFLGVNNKSDEHIVFFHSKKDLVLNDIEQLTIINEGNVFLFVDLQDRVVYHDFEDSFAVLLEPLGEVNCAKFIKFEGEFRFHIELPVFKFLFMFEKSERRKQSSNYWLD